MKVYLVKNTYGSYEDVGQSIDKIFDTSAKADDYIKTIISRMYDLKELHNNLSDTGHDEHDDIYDKALERFYIDFPDSSYDSWDGNTFTILVREVE